MEKHIDPKPESGQKFYQDFSDKGKVVMLNLLKFRSTANYNGFEKLKPVDEITGEDAYKLYLDKTHSELEKLGSKILFFGDSKNFLIGPDHEIWDSVLLVEHQSAAKLIEFSQSKEYMNNSGHRTAALEDSRVLPIIEKKKKVST